jgi:protein-L-isoaspartate(D-aspartate) O-methyltransferase
MAATILEFETARRHMVDKQLIARGIRDPLVLAAMGKVPREKFVSVSQAQLAYTDGPCRSVKGRRSPNPTSSRS